MAPHIAKSPHKRNGDLISYWKLRQSWICLEYQKFRRDRIQDCGRVFPAEKAVMLTPANTSARPVINSPESEVPRKSTDASAPISGTPSVKLDMANTLIRRPCSDEMTKQTEVATGPIKNKQDANRHSVTAHRHLAQMQVIGVHNCNIHFKRCAVFQIHHLI